MTREEKIIAFMKEDTHSIRWCGPEPCGCMGCINGSRTSAWAIDHPDELPITKEEFDRLAPQISRSPRGTINFNFRGI